MRTILAALTALPMLACALAALGCAVQVGPVGFAIGNAAIEREDGEVVAVRGGALSHEFVGVWEATVGRLGDVALAFLGRPPVSAQDGRSAEGLGLEADDGEMGCEGEE